MVYVKRIGSRGDYLGNSVGMESTRKNGGSERRYKFGIEG
jgi:hypothetical protein